MNYWSGYPFVRILFAFIAGILLCLFGNVYFPLWLLPLSFLITLSLHFFGKNKTARLYRYATLIGFSFQLSFVVLGNILTHEKIDLNDPDQFVHHLPKADWAIVRVTAPITEKEKSYKVTAEVLATGKNHEEQKTNGSTILYFQKDSEATKLEYGDEVLVKNNFQPVALPKNPDEFNYRQYLWYREIYATAYLRSSDWKPLPAQIKNPIYQFTYWLQDISLGAIHKYVPSSREAAVCEGLVIGYRDDMSFDIQQSYTAAGVVHVLAVSGMQIGILFAFMHQLLFFLNRKKNGKIIQSIIIIAIIWLFALLTGLSGSVVRAAAMFSFVTIGKNMRRSINLNNILACSALFILFFNPLLIMDAGLQLSYFAVFGIGVLFRPINSWVYSENKIVNFCWTTISMSLAAQVATLPVTIYYFNQFPTYFLLANLIVIPAAGIILYLGIALITLQAISPLAIAIGKVTYSLAWILNEFILRIQSLPHAVIHLPAFPLAAAVMLSLGIIFISRYFMIHRKSSLIAGLVSFSLVVIYQSFDGWQQYQQKTITLYSLKGKSNLEFRSEDETLLFQNDSLSTSETSYLHRHWWLNGIDKTDFVSANDSSGIYLDHHLIQQASFFQFYDRRIAIINKPLDSNNPDHKIKVDAVIISSNPNLNMQNLLSHFETETVVFDANNSSYRIKTWKKEADTLGVKTYDVNEEGAYVLRI